AVQLQSNEDVAANLERVRYWLGHPSMRDAQLVLLPENFAYFGPDAGKLRHAEDLDHGGPIGDALRGLARARGLTLIAGGMPERSDDVSRPYNTSVVFG